ncbi:hypothetical protein LAZ67_20002706, partial [Cordylochernes scorpioides]
STLAPLTRQQISPHQVIWALLHPEHATFIEFIFPKNKTILVDFLEEALELAGNVDPVIRKNLITLQADLVVDTKDGFWNVKLSEESSNLTTFWTPFGRYKFLRMPFGLKTASEEYQRRLYEIFQGLEGIEIIADDILILGKAPVDWSLKTKLRLISTKPYPWRTGVFKSLEQASGTTSAVRCLHTGSEPLRDSIIDTTPAAQFFQHCLYWQFPHLPWVSTFPRIVRNKKHGTKCLTSLLQLVKSRQCLYFYLCAPTFTVLFRAAGVAGMLGAHALISPTTSAQRKALLAEDIQFTMPLRKAGEESTDSSSLSQSQEDEEEEPADWLQSMGAGDELLSSLNSSNTRGTGHDNHERTGPLAGVPPTLLAPTAFLGGSLQCLSRRHVVVEGGKYVVELSGPVLPSAVYHLGLLTIKTTSFEKAKEEKIINVIFSVKDFSQRADIHLCVSSFMRRDLFTRIKVEAHVVYDCPTNRFNPDLSMEEAQELLTRLAQEYPVFGDGGDGNKFTTEDKEGQVVWREDGPLLVVSSTSWTEDEDMGLLLRAMHQYSQREGLPEVVCVVTGKGPLKAKFEAKLKEYDWNNVSWALIWLKTEDYPRLLACADLGVCLHISSSGVDLPMKIVDMFSAGLPVVAVNYPALSELLQPRVFGEVFSDANELTELLVRLLSEPERKTLGHFCQALRGYLKIRWEENWDLVVGPIFHLSKPQ